MSGKSINKGKCGEREFCIQLGCLTGLALVRNLDQTREGGHDVKLAGDQDEQKDILEQLDQFAIEVKRYAIAKPNDINRWWQQAVQQSDRVAKQPMLAYRLDRERWQCMVHIGQCKTEDITGCIRMDIALFAELLKNGSTILDD